MPLDRYMEKFAEVDPEATEAKIAKLMAEVNRTKDRRVKKALNAQIAELQKGLTELHAIERAISRASRLQKPTKKKKPGERRRRR